MLRHFLSDLTAAGTKLTSNRNNRIHIYIPFLSFIYNCPVHLSVNDTVASCYYTLYYI